MFKKDSQSKAITFDELYQTGRLYGLLFNEDEFKWIWRRSKNRKATLEELSGDIKLTFDQLHSILLVSNFNTKPKWALQMSVPLK